MKSAGTMRGFAYEPTAKGYRALPPLPSPESIEGEKYHEARYKIKYGDVEIESKDAEHDYRRIKSKVDELNGYVERLEKRDYESYLEYYLKVRVPSDDFERFISWLIDNFNVKSTNAGFYMEEVARTLNEIEVLNQAMQAYDELLERVKEMEPSEKTIRLVMSITDEKLRIARMLKELGYSLNKTAERAFLPSVTIRIRQEKEIKIMPRGLTRRLKEEIRDMMYELSTTLISFVTGVVTLLVKVVVFVAQALIVFIPIVFGLRIGLEIVNRVLKKR